MDLFSTGISWSRLFARLNTRARCFFLGRVDNYAYLQDGLNADDWLDMHTVFRNSELGTPLSKGVEMLNYAAHAVVEDVLCLPAKAPLALLADTLEYDPALPQAAGDAFRACVQGLTHLPFLHRGSNDSLADLIKALVRFICADQHLPTIYPGHEAADAAYLQSILT